MDGWGVNPRVKLVEGAPRETTRAEAPEPGNAIIPRVLALRPAEARDAAFLGAMLVAAVNWREGDPARAPGAVMADPLLSRYVTGWPRAGEAGVVAEAGRPVGAAWWRRFPAEAPGFGFIDADTPEVALGVIAEERGKGVGERLLAALVERAREEGLAALSLSVGRDNRRAVRLYERVGFVPVGDGDPSETMRLEILPAPGEP